MFEIYLCQLFFFCLGDCKLIKGRGRLTVIFIPHFARDKRSVLLVGVEPVRQKGTEMAPRGSLHPPWGYAARHSSVSLPHNHPEACLDSLPGTLTF